MSDYSEIRSKDKQEDQETQAEITRLGNPRKPEGEAGEQMLDRMNADHSGVTSWALSKIGDIESDSKNGNMMSDAKNGDIVPDSKSRNMVPDADSVIEILDIGCGGGNTLKLLSRQYPQARLYGIDYSEVSVKKTMAYNQDAVESGRLQVLLGSVEEMPYEDETFSVITTVESFYFWPDPLENLKEVRRVLKTGGSFYLIADIYGKEGLSESVLENIAEYSLTNPTVEEFIWLFSMAGFRKTKIHLRQGTDWICVEGRK